MGTFNVNALLGLTVSCIIACTASHGAVWDAPIVAFDIGYSIECHDVTPDTFKERYPDRKLVEAVFPLSPRLLQGNESDIRKIQVDVQGPSLRVHAYMPATEIGSSIAGPIVVEERRDGASVTVRYRIHDENQSGDVEARLPSKQSRMSFEKLPPQEVRIASGTRDRRTGAWWTFHNSSQVTLQRDLQLAIVFEVPSYWEGDWIILDATTHGVVSRNLLRQEKLGECGGARFAVGLHLAGSYEARMAAEKLAQAQEAYWQKLADNTSADPNWLDRYQAVSPYLKWIMRSQLRATSTDVHGPAVEYLLSRPESTTDSPASDSELCTAKEQLRLLSGNH